MDIIIVLEETNPINIILDINIVLEETNPIYNWITHSINRELNHLGFELYVGENNTIPLYEFQVASHL